MPALAIDQHLLAWLELRALRCLPTYALCTSAFSGSSVFIFRRPSEFCLALVQTNFASYMLTADSPYYHPLLT